MVSSRSLKVFVCLVATTVATLFCQHSSIAASVGVNYGADQANLNLLPTEFAGLVPQQNWNNVTTLGAPFPNVTANLTKDTAGVGSPSGIKLSTGFAPASQIAGSTVTNFGAPLNTGDRKMMEQYADVLDFGTTSLTLENLAGFGPFDLILYSGGTWNAPDPDRVAQYDFYNGTSTASPLLVTRLIRNKPNPLNVPNDAYKESVGDGTFAGTLEGNYIRISNLNPSSGSLFLSAKALQPGSPARGAINGFQLIQVSGVVPEPGTIALLVIVSLAGATLFRRR